MNDDRKKASQPSAETNPKACNTASDDICPEETVRDPEDREVRRARIKELREKMMDKTLADSFPSSDPPSSIPNPGEDDSIKKEVAEVEKKVAEIDKKDKAA